MYTKCLKCGTLYPIGYIHVCIPDFTKTPTGPTVSPEMVYQLDGGLVLDRIIAERLGWTEIEETEGWWDDPDGTACRAYLQGERADYPYASNRIPFYSTEIDAALQLFGALTRPHEWRIVMEYTPHGPIYYASISVHGEVYARVYANTLPLAVCRTWLRWYDGKSAK